MIDRPARDRYAFILRQLASGRITTDAFDSEAWQIELKTEDAALKEIHQEAYCLYHDLWSYRLRRKSALDRVTKRRVARVILFLRSDETVIGEGPLAEPSEGALGLFDLFVGFVIVCGLIIAIAQWGSVGAVIGLVVLAVWLWSIHKRQLAWRAKWRALINSDAIWPFANSVSLKHSLASPFYLSGGSRELRS